MDDVRHEYDLEERTFQFALAVRSCIAGSKWTRVQWTDVDQLLRSSGSIAANYIEEASESKLWLRLLGETSLAESVKSTLRVLFKESDEITRILATILRNSQK